MLRRIGHGRGSACHEAFALAQQESQRETTSFMSRSTATPSPHECSKLSAVRASEFTMSWNDLSNQRLLAWTRRGV
mgnify:CR=1 FL=1